MKPLCKIRTLPCPRNKTTFYPPSLDGHVAPFSISVSLVCSAIVTLALNFSVNFLSLHQICCRSLTSTHPARKGWKIHLEHPDQLPMPVFLNEERSTRVAIARVGDPSRRIKTACVQPNQCLAKALDVQDFCFWWKYSIYSIPSQVLKNWPNWAKKATGVHRP